jgi:hypothetical protein
MGKSVKPQFNRLKVLLAEKNMTNKQLDGRIES